ncbi:MAG: hypothetical protein IID33_02075 [Planctomycetes bacterium]|nr:hypothetical protein [Planctomycetota bacterium]
MLHAGPGEFGRLDEVPRLYRNVKLVNIGWSDYGVGDRPGQVARRRHSFIGPNEGSDRFRALAADAGRCLVDVPTKHLSGIEFESINASRAFNRWVWSVYDLAWRGNTGSPLRAERKLWESGFPTSPYDVEFYRRFIKGGQRNPLNPSVFAKWAESLPDYFCSELSDAFMCSVYAIDILLGGQLDADDAPPRDHTTARDFEGRPKTKKKKAQGRRKPTESDMKKDRKLAEDWQGSDCRTLAEFARLKGKSPRDVRRALDRVKSRRNK